eukprot:1699573-Alexandrium_andersonii.AAC.1
MAAIVGQRCAPLGAFWSSFLRVSAPLSHGGGLPPPGSPPRKALPARARGARRMRFWGWVWRA